MSNRRLEAVKEAFRLLDSRGTGVVELEEIVDAFNALGHPDVKTKKKSAHQAMREFGDALKVVCPDGKVCHIPWFFLHLCRGTVTNTRFVHECSVDGCTHTACR